MTRPLVLPLFVTWMCFQSGPRVLLLPLMLLGQPVAFRTHKHKHKHHLENATTREKRPISRFLIVFPHECQIDSLTCSEKNLPCHLSRWSTHRGRNLIQRNQSTKPLSLIGLRVSTHVWVLMIWFQRTTITLLNWTIILWAKLNLLVQAKVDLWTKLNLSMTCQRLSIYFAGLHHHLLRPCPTIQRPLHKNKSYLVYLVVVSWYWQKAESSTILQHLLCSRLDTCNHVEGDTI